VKQAGSAATLPAGGQEGALSEYRGMDHQYIEGHNILDRYLQETLSAAERTRFEEHFIDCAECLDRLEMTEDFRGALRTVAAEHAATSSTSVRPGLRAWLMGLTGGRQVALAAAAILLLIALPTALLVIATGQTRREIDQARLSAADWQRRYEESQLAARNVEKEMQARMQELSAQRLEIEAQRERERQTRVVEEGSRQALLQAAAPIFELNTVRSGNAGRSALATRISVPRSARWIVLKVEVDPDPQLQSYRATLLTSDQQVICRASDLIAVKEALAISCDASLFKPGDYRLALEGLARQGQYVSAGAYSFHVVRP
jgi:hypothetical protein